MGRLFPFPCSFSCRRGIKNLFSSKKRSSLKRGKSKLNIKTGPGQAGVDGGHVAWLARLLLGFILHRSTAQFGSQSQNIYFPWPAHSIGWTSPLVLLSENTELAIVFLFCLRSALLRLGRVHSPSSRSFFRRGTPAQRQHARHDLRQATRAFFIRHQEEGKPRESSRKRKKTATGLVSSFCAPHQVAL